MARQKNDGKDHKITARLPQGKRVKNERFYWQENKRLRVTMNFWIC